MGVNLSVRHTLQPGTWPRSKTEIGGEETEPNNARIQGEASSATGIAWASQSVLVFHLPVSSLKNRQVMVGDLQNQQGHGSGELW